MPRDGPVPVELDEVAEERLLPGKDLPHAHHRRAIDVALAGGCKSVRGEVAERGAGGYAVEFVGDHLRPAAERERVDDVLLLHLGDGGEERGGLLQLTFLRRVGGIDVRIRKKDLLRLLHLLRRHGARRLEDLVLRDVLDLRADVAAERQLAEAARVEARHAPADHADAKALQGADRLRRADDAVERPHGFVLSWIAVHPVVGYLEPPEVVRVHVRGAEAVALEAASGVPRRLGDAPEYDRDAKPLSEERRHNAERERQEVAHHDVGTRLLEFRESRERVGLGLEHPLATDDLHAVEGGEESPRVGTRLLERVARPVLLRERKISDLEHFSLSFLLETPLLRCASVHLAGGPIAPDT